MLDITKPMASKMWGNVSNFHLLPEWIETNYPLVCRFGNMRLYHFTKDGVASLEDGANPETDLYNIEEKPYWSKPEDVPMDAEWLRHKDSIEGARFRFDVENHGLLVAGCGEEYEYSNGVIQWSVMEFYEYYNGKEWKECRVE